MRAESVFALVACVGGCSLFSPLDGFDTEDPLPSSDAGDGAAPEAGGTPIVFRASSVVEGVGKTATIAVPSGTREGDLLWAIFANEYDNRWTTPSGFANVVWDFDPSCGLHGWTLTVLARIASAGEPASYSFTCDATVEHFAAMIALGGIGSDAPLQSSIARIASNPYITATPPAGSRAYALLTASARDQRSATWSPTAQMLFSGSTFGLFGRTVAAGEAPSIGEVRVTPSACGKAYLAVLPLP